TFIATLRYRPAHDLRELRITAVGQNHLKDQELGFFVERFNNVFQGSTSRVLSASLVCSPVSGSNSPRCFPRLLYFSTAPCWLSHSKMSPSLLFHRFRKPPPP